MYGRILAAVDGSRASVHTLKQAVWLARSLDVDLYTISIQELPTSLEVIGTEVEVPQALHDEFFEEARDEIRRAAEESGVRLRSAKVIKGNPASAILRHIEETGFDFVVLGRRGRGIMHRLRWRSTAHKVMACAKCPVIISPNVALDAAVGARENMAETSKTF